MRTIERTVRLAGAIAAILLATAGAKGGGGKGAGAKAGGSPCDSLTADQKQLAAQIAGSTYLYDCCDQTVEKCLKKKPACRLAGRLSREICSRVGKGQEKETIVKALSLRAKSMAPSAKKAAIDTAAFDTWAGEADAKVTIVGYVCARCGVCAKVVPQLHKEVTQGKLKGKARLAIKPFPIKTHALSTEGALAMTAAMKLGKFWPYLHLVYKNYAAFKAEKLAPWAAELGMDEAKFKELSGAQEVKDLVVESKKEGLKLGVDGTPTFFIDGKQYVGDHQAEYLADAVEEEHDRVTGNIYEGG